MLQVTAIDPDTGIIANLTYSIEGIAQAIIVLLTRCWIRSVVHVSFFFLSHILPPGTTAEGLFEISADTGLITVSSQIDREKTGDVVTLTVKVPHSLTSVFFLLFSLCLCVYLHLKSRGHSRLISLQKNKKVPTHSCTHMKAQLTFRSIDRHQDQQKNNLPTSQ